MLSPPAPPAALCSCPMLSRLRSLFHSWGFSPSPHPGRSPCPGAVAQAPPGAAPPGAGWAGSSWERPAQRCETSPAPVSCGSKPFPCSGSSQSSDSWPGGNACPAGLKHGDFEGGTMLAPRCPTSTASTPCMAELRSEMRVDFGACQPCPRALQGAVCVCTRQAAVQCKLGEQHDVTPLCSPTCCECTGESVSAFPLGENASSPMDVQQQIYIKACLMAASKQEGRERQTGLLAAGGEKNNSLSRLQPWGETKQMSPMSHMSQMSQMSQKGLGMPLQILLGPLWSGLLVWLPLPGCAGALPQRPASTDGGGWRHCVVLLRSTAQTMSSPSAAPVPCRRLVPRAGVHRGLVNRIRGSSPGHPILIPQGVEKSAWDKRQQPPASGCAR